MYSDLKYAEFEGKIGGAKKYLIGSTQSVASIFTIAHGGSCDVSLQVGKEYLICDNGEKRVRVLECGYSGLIYDGAKIPIF
jgi:hypothetical protein